MLPGKEGSKGRDSKLGESLELQPEVASFLQGSPNTSDNEDGKVPPEPAVLNFAEWVSWKAARCDTPSWWMELSTVPGENNTRRLAREVRASFQLPWWMHELESKEALFQAPLAPPCLHRRRFMPLLISIFASQDIKEIPWEKTIAYAQALQHWAKQNSPPVRGEPRLLAESVLELRKEVDFYLSFTDEEVFQGVVLPKEEGEGGSLNPSIADTPVEHCTFKPMPEEKVLQYAGWEKVLHPSWPMVAGGTAQPMRTSKAKRESPPALPTDPS